MSDALRRSRSRSPGAGARTDNGLDTTSSGDLVKVTFATLTGSTANLTVRRDATLQESQRTLREAFGKTEEITACVVLAGHVSTRGDDTPFEFAPDDATIVVIFKRPQWIVNLRRGF